MSPGPAAPDPTPVPPPEPTPPPPPPKKPLERNPPTAECNDAQSRHPGRPLSKFCAKSSFGQSYVASDTELDGKSSSASIDSDPGISLNKPDDSSDVLGGMKTSSGIGGRVCGDVYGDAAIFLIAASRGTASGSRLLSSPASREQNRARDRDNNCRHHAQSTTRREPEWHSPHS